MPIQTDRLILRVFNREDFSMLRELDSDPLVLRYRSRKHISPEMTHEFLERAQQSIQAHPRLFYAYAIVRRDGLEWLGQCGLTVLAPEAEEAFTWYSMLPRYWGQGYMGEAVRALLYVGAAEFQLRRIFAECHPDNGASIRVMQKAGMQPEGRVQFTQAGGETEERIRYGLARGDLERLGGTNIRVEPPL